MSSGQGHVAVAVTDADAPFVARTSVTGPDGRFDRLSSAAHMARVAEQSGDGGGSEEMSVREQSRLMAKLEEEEQLKGFLAALPVSRACFLVKTDA